MTVAKPADLVLWVPGDEAAKMTSPSAGKRVAGWILGEKPAFQTMNYLQNNWGKWANYVDQMPLFVNDVTAKVIGWGVDVLDGATYNAGGGGGQGEIVAFGNNAGKGSDSNTSVYIGYESGLNRDSGVGVGEGNTVCIGHNAGALASSSGVSKWGVYIGAQSGLNSEGEAQICLGISCAGANDNNYLIAIGYNAADSAVHGANSIFIGYEVGKSASLSTDSVVWIGDSDTSTPLIQGNFTDSLLVINGDLQSTGYIAVEDGMAAPGTVSGKALIYVDTADGDLKCKFGDGTVKTIATDT